MTLDEPFETTYQIQRIYEKQTRCLCLYEPSLCTPSKTNREPTKQHNMVNCTVNLLFLLEYSSLEWEIPACINACFSSFMFPSIL